MFSSYAAPLCITGSLLTEICYALLILCSRGVQSQSSRAAVQLDFLSYQAENAFAKESGIPSESAGLQPSRAEPRNPCSRGASKKRIHLSLRFCVLMGDAVPVPGSRPGGKEES